MACFHKDMLSIPKLFKTRIIMFLNKSELAAYIGVGRNNVYHILNTDPTFPKPVYIMPCRPQWLDTAIDAWAQARSDAVNQKPNGGRAA